MRTRKKIDALIIVFLMVSSLLFFYRAGYIYRPPSDEKKEVIPDTKPPDHTPTVEETLILPVSFIPAYRRDVSPEDEGVHFNKLRVNREWWYFSAVFNDKDSELYGWTVQISFNHMARSDLLGTGKPDLLLVTLLSPDGVSYGGIANKKRNLGVINQGTLIANSPGVKLQFEDSWAEGSYPKWHIHVKDGDIDADHDIVIDLDYQAKSLPLWILGNRAFEKSESTLASYIILGCMVTGRIQIDQRSYSVKGVGHHEHTWTPLSTSRMTVNGWDWLCLTLDNGWVIHISNYYITPQALTEKTTLLNPLGTVILTTDRGETILELKNLDVRITGEDTRVFAFVNMPTGFSITAKPSLNPLYAISQSLLLGTGVKLTLDVNLGSSYNKMWRFPTYLGMKTSICNTTGSISWSNEESYDINLKGVGVAWSMRALI
jgi:predicted secreted hydrolase